MEFEALDIIYHIFGPRLYMDYNTNSEEMYSLAVLEQIGDYLLTTVLLLLRITVYTSPMTILLLYRKNYTKTNVFYACLAIILAVGFLLAIAVCFRAIGRYQSESYRNLIAVLKSKKPLEEKRTALAKYDFDFRWWPVDFDARTIPSRHVIPALNNQCDLNFVNGLKYISSYIFAHSIGVYLLYPGSIELLQSYLRPSLVEGRAEIILQRRGCRYKVKTVDRNEIDTVFIDNRERTKNGSILVINSEGNMSFYEIGITNTSLAQDFSVLGWNHPGFEGSTGCPFPIQEYHAIDAVVKFAIYKLNFEESDIMLYGWSIGGYSTICGATKWSKLKGIILDGTFDDIIHLANDEVPTIFQNFVNFAIRCHINLNNAELLKKYEGPVLIVRRVYDETISPDSRLPKNRTNNLIIELLKYRYPNVFEKNQIDYIGGILSRPLKACSFKIDEVSACWTRLLSHVAVNGKSYPMTIGENLNEKIRYEMAEFLLRQYCRDFYSSHCPPLSPEFFQIPWDGCTRQ